jgi:hypothetical protein
MRAVALASCGLLALAMATAATAPPQPDAFVRRAGLVCDRAVRESEALQRGYGGESTAASQLFGRVELARRQAAALRRLPVRREDEERRARLLRSFDDVADVMEEYARAVRRGDRETRKTLVVPDGPVAQRVQAARDAAEALGLARCDGRVSPSGPATAAGPRGARRPQRPRAVPCGKVRAPCRSRPGARCPRRRRCRRPRRGRPGR